MAAAEWRLQGVCGTGSLAALGRGRARHATPRKAVKNYRAAPRFDRIPHYAESPLSGRVGDHPPPRIVEVSGAERYLWDYLVHRYQYLGRPRLVGEYLKQLVFILYLPKALHPCNPGSSCTSQKHHIPLSLTRSVPLVCLIQRALVRTIPIRFAPPLRLWRNHGHRLWRRSHDIRFAQSAHGFRGWHQPDRHGSYYRLRSSARSSGKEITAIPIP